MACAIRAKRQAHRLRTAFLAARAPCLVSSAVPTARQDYAPPRRCLGEARLFASHRATKTRSGAPVLDASPNALCVARPNHRAIMLTDSSHASVFKMGLRQLGSIMLLLFASYACAIFINADTRIWVVIERIPEPINLAIGHMLNWVSQPLQPEGAHEQEEYLDLLIVWFWTMPATIPMLIGARAITRWAVQCVGATIRRGRRHSQ